MHPILVAAMTKNRVIGNNNQLPWDIPEEMADFRSFTQGKIIVMGRKTYEWLWRILPKRRNIMLTRNPESVKIWDFLTVYENGIWRVDWGEKWQIEIYTSKEALLAVIDENEEVLILGWAEIYKLFLDDTLSQIRLSEIHNEYDGDTYFPEFYHLYTEISRENKGNYDLVWYKRKI